MIRTRLLISSALCMSVLLSLYGCAHSDKQEKNLLAVNTSSFATAAPSYPDDKDKRFGYFPNNRPATGKWAFIFDPNHTSWAAYNEYGELVNVGRASGGSDFCPDVGRPCRTITGKFKILLKKGADCESSIYPIETNGGAPMPYCMFFSAMGYAIHGSYDVPDYNASHGCIRVTPNDAEWLSENLSTGSTVMVLPYHS